jgi:hypothetical protein
MEVLGTATRDDDLEAHLKPEAVPLVTSDLLETPRPARDRLASYQSDETDNNRPTSMSPISYQRQHDIHPVVPTIIIQGETPRPSMSVSYSAPDLEGRYEDGDESDYGDVIAGGHGSRESSIGIGHGQDSSADSWVSARDGGQYVL